MKKILFLTGMKNGIPFTGSTLETSMLAGCARLNASTKDMQWFAAGINDLAIEIKGGEVAVYDLRHECPLTDYAFIQFRNVNVELMRDYFQAIALFAEHEGIPFADAEDVRGTPFGKISQMVRFALRGVSVPNTLTVWNDKGFRRLAKDIATPPFICKANNGMKGRRNYLVASWEEFDSLLQVSGHEGYIVQPFIPNEGDYRILYIGTNRLVFYRQRQSGTHLNNTSQNATGRRIAENDCDPAVLELADRAMRIYGRNIGGVDVVVDADTSKAYILEINNTPAILSGVFQDEKSQLYAIFVEQQLSTTRKKAQ